MAVGSNVVREQGAPRARRVRAAALAWSDAYLAALAFLVIECIVVAIVARDELGGLWEFVRIVQGLLPVAAAAAGGVALGGAVLLLAVRHGRTRAARWIAGLVLAALAVLVAVGVSQGRLLAGGRRPWFVGVVTVVALLMGIAGVGPLQRLSAGVARRGRGTWVLLMAAGVAALALINAYVLVRLYPAFHLGLAVLSLWAAALCAIPFGGRPPLPPKGWRWRVGVAATVLLASIATTPWAARQLSGYDNIRFIYLDRAPTLTHAVELAARLAPPLPLDEPLGYGPARSAGPSLNLRDRDVLLITIDALRADHVGAYGYDRPTTPAIDALAAEGVVFEHAYTPTPHTSYAVASLMTGRYMRSLMRQGLAAGAESWARYMRRYGYRTAAFYPPAVFFIDRGEFVELADSGLGFEYRKEQFASAASRVEQLRRYLQDQSRARPLFVWVHLYEPHEPYEAHPGSSFGDRDVDRYDGEIAAADRGVGEMVALMKQLRPPGLTIIAADHGEEFGDHGGRYHGTTVYEEQVRVPLVFHGPGLLAARRIREPVSLVDLMPTVLAGLGVPQSPRLHGRDLGPLLLGGAGAPEGEGEGEGFAFAETDDQTLLALGSMRLLCLRKVGACRLFDLADDPRQRRDVAGEQPELFATMKGRTAGFVARIGRYGAAESKEPGTPEGGWPPALRRGIAGEGDAAADVASLLDDADMTVRRKAAEVLFELRRDEAAPQLRRTLGREDEDEMVRRWCALALTRIGQGAPLTYDLVQGDETRWRRLAALALAESGDDRGESELLDWWGEMMAELESSAGRAPHGLYQHAAEVAHALAAIRSEAAVGPLTKALAELRLRRDVAGALAEIGEDAARPALARALAEERYHNARVALAEALVRLGASGELRKPLTRFLGVPDPLPRGLELAMRAEIVPFIGGPRKREVERLREFANSGVVIGVVVPEGGNGRGYRVLVRAKSTDGHPGQVRFGLLAGPPPSGKDRDALVPAAVPRLDPGLTVALAIPAADRFHEVFGSLPPAAADRVEPGEHEYFVVYATQNVELATCAVVPLADELPPPQPE